jgi:septal ring factor EnvC (AmiA/AmiB activator)
LGQDSPRPFATPEWRTKQNEIGRARTELRQVDDSLQDLNRRIQHLESITEKWQVHTPRSSDEASRFNQQI